jgi:hypothetical protein
MQGYTHIIVGALCGKAAASRFKGRTAIAVGVLLAAPTHPFLDIASQMTYHPVDGSLVRGAAWITYHAIAYLLAIALLLRFKQHWPAVVSALWPDFDWFIRPLHLRFWPDGMLHTLAWKFPLIQALQDFATAHLPDLRGYPVAGIPEIAVSVALAWYLIRREQLLRPALQPQLATSSSVAS